MSTWVFAEEVDGAPGEAALEEIARLRRNLSGGSIISPYTEGQRNMVREWPE